MYKVDPKKIRYFLQQIVSAMKALDEKGIIHRDLKPQNILLNREEQNRLRVKIGTFYAYTYYRYKLGLLRNRNPVYLKSERGKAINDATYKVRLSIFGTF